jgi:dUTP pyrophosphatase
MKPGRPEYKLLKKIIVKKGKMLLNKIKNLVIKFYKIFKGDKIMCNCNDNPTDIPVVFQKDKSQVIKVKKIDKDVPDLEKLEVGDWIDLRFCDVIKAYYPDGREYDFKTTLKGKKPTEFKIIQGFTYLISLGIAVELPKGYEARITNRGSTFRKTGLLLTNDPVVDESFKGDNDLWFVPCLAHRNITIPKYERLWQFRIDKKMPELKIKYVDKLLSPDRGGFGSTDIIK